MQSNALEINKETTVLNFCLYKLSYFTFNSIKNKEQNNKKILYNHVVFILMSTMTEIGYRDRLSKNQFTVHEENS